MKKKIVLLSLGMLWGMQFLDLFESVGTPITKTVTLWDAVFALVWLAAIVTLTVFTVIAFNKD